jgi:hypothetical protein
MLSRPEGLVFAEHTHQPGDIQAVRLPTLPTSLFS